MSQPRFSYAQNFEDVYISRAFSDVDHGFYVDIGAFHADTESVTKLFYEDGWSGINVEPGPSFDTLSASRPRDINLKAAVSDEPGSATFYYHEGDPGTSTLLAALDERLETRVGERIETSVETMTLEALFENHVGDRTVQFLKIDVEGWETRIIAATDWNRWRPELILVEATLPYSNIRQDKKWNRYLHAARYHLVFFDGINVYYLREESLHRRHAFDRPVNVIDGFKKFDDEARVQIAILENKLASQTELMDQDEAGAASQTSALGEQVATLQAAVAERDSEIDTLKAGWSGSAEQLKKIDAMYQETALESQALSDALTAAEAARDQAQKEAATLEGVQQAARELIESSLSSLVASASKDAAELARLQERYAALEAELAASRASQSNMTAVALAAEESEREASELRRELSNLNLQLAEALQSARSGGEDSLALATVREDLAAALEENAELEIELERLRISRTSLVDLAQTEVGREVDLLRAELGAMRNHRDEIFAALENANAFGARVNELFHQTQAELQEAQRQKALVEAQQQDLLVNLRLPNAPRSLRASLLLGRLMRRVAQRLRRFR